MAGFYVAGSCVATTQYHAASPVNDRSTGIRPGSRPAKCLGCGERTLPGGHPAVVCHFEGRDIVIYCGACGRLRVNGEPVTPCPRCDNLGVLSGYDTDSGCIDCPDCGGSGALPKGAS